ncbi:helix-turn-helix domain-containing protein [Streptomyces sp. NRRL F-5123]|uniref:helix-turn-helix domain-containing protein n=1 Tax=Streptomyces sp. NRRL F-5123 TaxID=1463856 RepID=UPI0004E19821|nr:helix-turn-helix domain-containing protein [Streptomyces sp. NRRL F-5123]
MYDLATRCRALALLAEGHSLNATSRSTGISRAAIRGWATHGPGMSGTGRTPLCTDGPAYPYLLGLYLGDGCLSRNGRGVYALRIACSNSWPGLIDACEHAIRAVRPGGSVCRVRQQGCVQVTACSKQWPTVFPQHGPGRKHERHIALEPWQQTIVDTYPWEFVRGLVHSDGCRITNWTTRLVGGEPKRYEYPRYFFTNVSDGIRALFCETLDLVGVEWRVAGGGKRPYSVSVARRASVELMDLHVGAKY